MDPSLAHGKLDYDLYWRPVGTSEELLLHMEQAARNFYETANKESKYDMCMQCHIFRHLSL